MYSHPSSLSVFPEGSRFVKSVLLLFIRAMIRFSVDDVSLWCLALRPMLMRSTSVFCSVSSCHMRHGRLHIRLDLMRGWTSVGILCPCGPKIVKGKSKCGDCSLTTTARIPSFSQNRCPRPRSMWQPRSLRNFFDNKSGAPPATTATMHTARYSVDPSNSNREYG